MKVTEHKKHNDGSHSFNVLATEQEVGILINIALQAFLAMGTVTEEDLANENYELFLDNLPEEGFFRA